MVGLILSLERDANICAKMASMGISISQIYLMNDFSWETFHKTDLRTVRRILFRFVRLSPPPCTTFWVGQTKIQRNLVKSA